ncbi:hypothetical protein SAT01_23320 [Sinomonas atrocyanea]|nr:hypothetical protein SAT01_23320 [Sinomonas atrocyanea]GGG80016.1 hypothetical protein GCM10007172_36570 [Sinomonas atrocyanea]
MGQLLRVAGALLGADGARSVMRAGRTTAAAGVVRVRRLAAGSPPAVGTDRLSVGDHPDTPLRRTTRRREGAKPVGIARRS